MQGLIFIPDISGFTNFVKSIPINLGVSITRDLLNEIIDNNPLNVQLSEIEGDAVFFYKLGKPINLNKLLEAFEDMSEAFCKKYALWKARYNIKADLSLKLIVHYGNIIVYNIRGFKKVYGEPVIDSHRLLKNGSTSTNYILITDDYMNALKNDNSYSFLCDKLYSSYGSHLGSDSKKISFSFFSNLKKGPCSSNREVTKEGFAA